MSAARSVQFLQPLQLPPTPVLLVPPLLAFQLPYKTTHPGSSMKILGLPLASHPLRWIGRPSERLCRRLRPLWTRRDRQRDYSESLQSHAVLRHRVAELERELAEFASSAAPFVAFAQERYDLLQHRLVESERTAHDRRQALEERLDNAREVEDMRDRLRFERGVHQDATASFQARIADPERELARIRAHPRHSSASVANSAGAPDPEVQRLHSERDSASAALLVARRELEEALDNVNALEASQKALEASASIFRQQVTLLERRIVDLRQQLLKQKTSSERVLDASLQERNRLQELLDKSDVEIQGRMAELRRVSAERDRYRDDSARTRTYVLPIFRLLH
jgi:predicted  nucleic acid-binding Zn-ribbon protein